MITHYDEEIRRKIKETEEIIQKTPYHKGTEHYVGKLKAKLAKLRSTLILGGVKSGGGGGGGYAVAHHGDAVCVLVGSPSVGKSTLLNLLTSASSKTGSYDFTTTNVVPGMMSLKGARIQVLDLPGLIRGAASGKGLGKRALSVARTADLIILMTDVGRPEALELIKRELYLNEVRLDQKKPDIVVKKTTSGGIMIRGFSKKIGDNFVKGVAEEFGIKNAEIFISEPIENEERLLDGFSPNRAFIPSLSVINKIDIASEKIVSKDAILISAEKNIGIEELREAIWKKLNLIRVYLKRSKNEDPDFNSPLIAKAGLNLNEIKNKLPESIVASIQKAQVFSKNSLLSGKIVSLEYVPKDEEIICFLNS